MTELEAKLREILDKMLQSVPAGDVAAREEALARFQAQATLLAEKAEARSGEAAAQRIRQVVELAVSEARRQDFDDEATEAGFPDWEENEPEETSTDSPAVEPEIEKAPAGVARVEKAPRTPRFRFWPGFAVAGGTAILCLVLGVAALRAGLIAPAGEADGLTIPTAEIEKAAPVLEEIRTAMAEIAKRAEAGLAADNPASKTPSRFVSVRAAFPDLHEALSPAAKRSGGFLIRYDKGGYKILSQGKLCVLAAQKYPQSVDRKRETDFQNICTNFGVWNEKGKSF